MGSHGRGDRRGHRGAGVSRDRRRPRRRRVPGHASGDRLPDVHARRARERGDRRAARARRRRDRRAAGGARPAVDARAAALALRRSRRKRGSTGSTTRRCARTRWSAPAATLPCCACAAPNGARPQDGLQRPLRLPRSARRARASPSPRRRATWRARARGRRPSRTASTSAIPRRPEVFFQFREAVARHGGSVRRARHAGHGRQRLALQRESERRGVPHPGDRHGRASSIDSTTSRARRSGRRAMRSSCSASPPRELGACEYLARVHGVIGRRAAARATSHAERALIDALLEASRRAGSSAHDCSDGGLAVALAECCIVEPRADARRHRRSRVVAGISDARGALRRSTGTGHRLDRFAGTRLENRQRNTAFRLRHGTVASSRLAVADSARGRAIVAPVERLAQPITMRFPGSWHASAAAASTCRERSFRPWPAEHVRHFRCSGSSRAASRTWGSTRCSIADRNPPASSPSMRPGPPAPRAMGLVSDGFAQEVAELHGTLAIGHTRYSTAGSSTIDNAQPVLARFRGGHIALAHNGNLTNATELRRELEKQGRSSRPPWTPRSSFTASRGRRPPRRRPARGGAAGRGRRVFTARRHRQHAARRARPSWLATARDRHVGGAYVVASETCALDIVGATVVRDVEPGEIIAIDECRASSITARPKVSRRCVFEYVYFSRPDSRVFGGSVDRARRALGRRLARESPRTRRRARLQRTGLVELRRVRLRGAVGAAARARADPQSLRRAHVHPADAGRARREGEGEVQRRARGARRKERRHGRRLDRTRHDHARTRRHGARCRGARGAYARQLAPDHGSVLLRNRHADARRAHRGEHHHRSRSPRTLASTRSGTYRSTGCSSPCPTDPAVLPRLLLRRLSNTAPDRPRQAPIRLRMLTHRCSVRQPSRPTLVYFFGNGKAEGTTRHEGCAWRKGSEPRRDDEPRRAGSARVHDRVLRRASSTSRNGAFPPSLVMKSRGRSRVGGVTGRGFGDTTNPLLVSVRSGAPVSMPGMMETILNLGLNDRTVVAWRARAGTRALPTTRIAASSRCTPMWCSAPRRRTSSTCSARSA